MMMIDFVNGYDEFDGSIWFFDGKYVGHDDQIEVTDFARKGEQQTILFRHRAFLPEVGFDEVEPYLAVRNLAELEHLLVPAP